MSNNKDLKENNDNNQDKIFKIRHSLAHVLAQSVQHLYENVKLGIGPAIDNGFYYDFIFPDSISDSDLEKIEDEMRKIIAKDYLFEQSSMPKDQAVEYLYKVNQPFKAELANELPDEELGFYTDGDFKDLCKGPHVGNTNEINPNAFKLTHIAGAYWRGDEKRPMMQRIYGVAFENKEELEKYLEQQDEAKKRDHRKLGKQLGLFTFSELVGSGLPMFTPRGTFLREELKNYSEKLQREAGFEQVWIPHITKIDLYKTSGHWDKFGDELFLVKSQETDDQMALKPMNCPHHTQIYASEPRSYRDLPVRYFESTTQYRDEKAGELLGLSRVRSMTLDDAHIFCTIDQIENEFENIMNMIKKMYSALGLTFRSRLSFRDDSEKYLGDIEDWNKAEETIERVAKKLELDYFIGKGEAAFYGPKIDIMVTDALGREWQCATQQLDFVQPKRFGLTYVDSDGQEKTPLMIHKALLGSIERFLSVYIEHTAGNFPLWLCYDKAVIVPISNDKHLDYSNKVASELRSKGLRVVVDDNKESMGNKIRKAQVDKMPYMLVIGDKEIENKAVSVRLRNGTNLGIMSVEEVGERMLKEVESKQ
jgi:threonyl-tRNA synthetase